jgi:hypothetical protein
MLERINGIGSWRGMEGKVMITQMIQSWRPIDCGMPARVWTKK